MIRFSVIVPTHNRPQQLCNCLAALARQDFPRDQFEVIVVDDGSEPPAAVGPGVTLLRQPNAGPATARNAGAAHARGTHLAFTDDDCAPTTDWLTQLAARLTGAPQSMIGGLTVNVLTANRYAAASQLLIDYLYRYYNSDADNARFLTSNNLAMPAALFQTLGGFDSRLTQAAGEDRDLCDRWRHAGYAMRYAPEAIVEHAHALTLPEFWQQHFRYGQAAFYFHQQRARRGQGSIQLEPLHFYSRLLRYPFLRSRGLLACTLTLLLALAQAANAGGYYSRRWSRR